MKKNVIVYGEIQTGIQKKAVAMLSEFLLDIVMIIRHVIATTKSILEKMRDIFI
jgi:hypothetical protein